VGESIHSSLRGSARLDLIRTSLVRARDDSTSIWLDDPKHSVLRKTLEGGLLMRSAQ